MIVLTRWRDQKDWAQGRRPSFHWASLDFLKCEPYNLWFKKINIFLAQKLYSALTISEEGLDVHSEIVTLFDDGRGQKISQISHGRMVNKLWECLRMECSTAIADGVGKYSSGMGKDGLQKMVLGHLESHMRKKCLLTQISNYTQKLIPDGLQT